MCEFHSTQACDGPRLLAERWISLCPHQTEPGFRRAPGQLSHQAQCLRARRRSKASNLCLHRASIITHEHSGRCMIKDGDAVISLQHRDLLPNTSASNPTATTSPSRHQPQPPIHTRTPQPALPFAPTPTRKRPHSRISTQPLLCSCGFRAQRHPLNTTCDSIFTSLYHLRCSGQYVNALGCIIAGSVAPGLESRADAVARLDLRSHRTEDYQRLWTEVLEVEREEGRALASQGAEAWCRRTDASWVEAD